MKKYIARCVRSCFREAFLLIVLLLFVAGCASVRPQPIPEPDSNLKMVNQFKASSGFQGMLHFLAFDNNANLTNPLDVERAINELKTRNIKKVAIISIVDPIFRTIV